MTIKGKACCAGHLAIWSKMIPTAAMWPHLRRRDTLQSANILGNKFTLLNLENSIVIYTIMTIKGKARCAGHLAIWSKVVRLGHKKALVIMWGHTQSLG